MAAPDLRARRDQTKPVPLFASRSSVRIFCCKKHQHHLPPHYSQVFRGESFSSSGQRKDFTISAGTGSALIVTLSWMVSVYALSWMAMCTPGMPQIAGVWMRIRGLGRAGCSSTRCPTLLLAKRYAPHATCHLTAAAARHLPHRTYLATQALTHCSSTILTW